MSIRSLTDFMEVSLRSVRRLASTATVTGRGDPQVDASVRGADFSWPKTGTSGGHQCGLFMAISADFLVATDDGSPGCRHLKPSPHGEMTHAPLFAVVSGPPGSGKTTLPTGIAQEMGLPLIAWT